MFYFCLKFHSHHPVLYRFFKMLTCYKIAFGYDRDSRY